MLTLPETIAAIRALNTAPDIITQACASVLRGDKPISDHEDLATLIVRTFIDHYDQGDLMLATIITGGKLGGLLTLPDKSGELLEGLQRVLNNAFHEAVSLRIDRCLRRDPLDAIDMLKEVVQSYKRVREAEE